MDTNSSIVRGMSYCHLVVDLTVEVEMRLTLNQGTFYCSFVLDHKHYILINKRHLTF